MAANPSKLILPESVVVSTGMRVELLQLLCYKCLMPEFVQAEILTFRIVFYQGPGQLFLVEIQIHHLQNCAHFTGFDVAFLVRIERLESLQHHYTSTRFYFSFLFIESGFKSDKIYSLCFLSSSAS